MYTIMCDGYTLHDSLSDECFLLDPKVHLAVNSACEASFTILPDHPNYDTLERLKSVIEVKDGTTSIFRGRILEERTTFDNRKEVQVEGVLGFTNDTVCPPFDLQDESVFPINSGPNVVSIFLAWVLEQHNAHVKEWQKIKLGNVSVTDPNNVLVRSSEEWLSTWEVLDTRLFNSSLGGYMYIRYEADGNYLDYVAEFPLTNAQHITLDTNMLDFGRETLSDEFYTAIFPRGATYTVTDPETNEDYDHTVTLADLENPSALVGDPNMEVVDRVYVCHIPSKEERGWIVAPLGETVWDEVFEPMNLLRKAEQYLGQISTLFKATIEIRAVDLQLTNSSIQSFRAFRNVVVDDVAHLANGLTYPLTELEIDITNPQNTVITVGESTRTLTGSIGQSERVQSEKWEDVTNKISGAKRDVERIKETQRNMATAIQTSAQAIVANAIQELITTGEVGELRTVTESLVQQTANALTATFSVLAERVNEIEQDYQYNRSEISKYIRFSVDGIEIGSRQSPLKLTLDNDEICFTQNNQVIGRWTGDKFYTGSVHVRVDEFARFGKFQFLPRSDGSLQFQKV